MISGNNGMAFTILISRILAFFLIKSIFLRLAKVCQFLILVHSEVRENIFHVLIKSDCMVFSFNGFVFNNLTFDF